MKMRKSWISAMILILGAMAAAGAVAAAAERTPLPPPVLKAVAYDLDFRFDYEAEKLFAECRLTVLNPSQAPVDKIPMILYRLLKVTSVSDEKGEAVPFVQRIAAFEDWDRMQVNFLEVTPRRIPASDRRILIIKYEGYLAGYADAGMLYVKDSVKRDFTIVRQDCLAYPEIGILSWEANRAAGMPAFDYLLKVTVPDDLVAANGGRLVDAVSKGGLTTYAYRNIKTAWRMDVAVAPYKIIEDKAANLKVFHFPEDAAGAEAVSKAAAAAKSLFSGWFGRLKEDRGFTIIEVPEGFGSQSDVTSILQTRTAFKDKSEMTQVYHEVAHIWDARPLDPAPCRVESEGVAMLLQYVAREKLDADAGALDRGAERIRESFRKACRSNPKAADTPIIEYGKADMTDLSYTKGMLFFYMIYKGAGEGPFLDALGRVRAKAGRSGTTTGEFLDSLQIFLKRDLSGLFEDWITGAASSRALLSETPLADIVKIYFPDVPRVPAGS